MAVLKIALVVPNERLVDIDCDSELKDALLPVPDIGSIEVGIEQLKQQVADRASELLAVRVVCRKQLDGA
jgi:hypothetical protein